MSSSWLSQILSLLIISLFSTACTNPTRRPKQILAPPTLTDQTIKLGPAIKVNEQISLHPTHFQHLNGWHQDNHQLAYKAFKRSCARWQTQADNKPLSGIFRLGQLSDWKRLCAITVPKGEEKRFFEAGFQPYAISDRNNFEGLFTGYYLPELHGSYQQSPRFKVPIYGIPADLLKRDEKVGRLQNGQFVPYYSRAEITAGSLRGKKAELLWVDNQIDAFFMEIQGSGVIIMEDGHKQGVSFAGKNGLPYYAIGRWLVENAYIPAEQISMQSIRNWLIDHPEEGQSLMQKNASVVFFRLSEAKPDEGPLGTMNTPLTAGYSLAVDNSLLPLGVPLWLDASPAIGEQRLQRLVIAQDTGGAIKGLIRGDVYWGQGTQAGEIAGSMKSTGRMFLLAPKNLQVE